MNEKSDKRYYNIFFNLKPVFLWTDSKTGYDEKHLLH